MKVVEINELALEVAATALPNASKKDVTNFTNSLINAVEENLKQGNAVRKVGFGTLKVRERQERIVSNPQDRSQKITVPSHNTVGFVVGKSLKDAINQ